MPDRTARPGPGLGSIARALEKRRNAELCFAMPCYALLRVDMLCFATRCLLVGGARRGPTRLGQKTSDLTARPGPGLDYPTTGSFKRNPGVL